MFFSIVIPAYNVERYIERCLNSILSQSFNDYEIIVIDDKSTDSTRAIVLDYALKNPAIILHSNNTKLSVGEARNIALRRASGEYILFVDADDYIKDGMLENIYTVLNESRADICFLPYHYIYQNMQLFMANIIKYNNSKMIFGKREDFIEYIGIINGTIPAAMWTAVCSRKLIVDNSIYINPEYLWSEDADFIFRVLRCSVRVAVCPFRGYVWNRDNISSITHSVNGAKLLSRLTVYKKWIDLIDMDAFGITTSSAKKCVLESIVRNYCGILGDYAFLKNKHDVANVRSRFYQDKIIKEYPQYVPKVYKALGLKYGRMAYIITHYFNRVLVKIHVKRFSF